MTKKQEAPCLFCGGLPCECAGGSKTKSKRSSKPRVLPEKKSSPTSPSVASTSDTEEIFGEIPTQVKPKFNIQSHSEERDLTTLSVLRLLRPLVCERDQRKIDKELCRTYPQDLDRRIAEWKARHAKE